jgi:hypothetical protein
MNFLLKNKLINKFDLKNPLNNNFESKNNSNNCFENNFNCFNNSENISNNCENNSDCFENFQLNDFGEIEDFEINDFENENLNDIENKKFDSKYIIENYLVEKIDQKIYIFNKFEKFIIFLYLKMKLNLVQVKNIFQILKLCFEFKSDYKNVENIIDNYNSNCNITVCYVCKHCKLIKLFNNLKLDIVCNCKNKMKIFFYKSISQFITSLIKNEKIETLNYYKSIMKNNTISDIFNSNYFLKYFKNKNEENSIYLYFAINTDGLQTKKNSKRSLYPFFLSLLNVDPKIRKKIKFNYLFSLFNKNKEEDVEFEAIFFLLVEEFKKLEKGIIINNVKVFGHIINVLADLPTISKIAHIKNFNGRSSCLYCLQEGELNDNRIVFPIEKIILRKKHEIINDMKNKKNGFNGEFSNLLRLQNFYFNRNISIDILHQFLCGICKFIISEISVENSVIYINSKNRKRINEYLKKIKYPSNYNKKLKSIENNKAFQILIIFLYGFKLFAIQKITFSFFEKINNILTICFSDYISNDAIKLLDDNINNFIIKFQIEFGKEKMNKNIHNLNHLIDDIQHLGGSKYRNMFLYEGFNHALNQNIFTNNFFEQQLLKKWNMEFNEDDEQSKDMLKVFNKNKNKSRKGLKVNDMILSKGDYIKTKDNNISKIKYFEEDNIILKNPNGINDTIINKNNVESYMIKTYDLTDGDNPCKIFLQDIGLNCLLS